MDLLKYIISIGKADIDRRNDFSETALHLAAACHNMGKDALTWQIFQRNCEVRFCCQCTVTDAATLCVTTLSLTALLLCPPPLSPGLSLFPSSFSQKAFFTDRQTDRQTH